METIDRVGLDDLITQHGGNGTPLYGLIDGARRQDAMQLIYTHDPQPEWARLYDGTRLAELKDKSPVLVSLKQDATLFELIRDELAPQRAAIIVQSSVGMSHIREHLAWLLEVLREDGSRLLFRYYEPVILESLHRHLSDAQANHLLGPVEGVYWLSPHELRWHFWLRPPVAEGLPEDYAERPWVLPEPAVSPLLAQQSRPNRLALLAYVNEHEHRPGDWSEADCLAFIERNLTQRQSTGPVTRGEMKLYLDVALKAVS